MPLRRVPGPPDLTRVVAVLGGPPPEVAAPAPRPSGGAEPTSPRPASSGWVPAGPDSRVGGRGAAGAPTDVELARLDADLRAAARPGLLTLPDQLRTGRLAVTSSAVVAMLALVLALGCVFVVRVLWTERSTGSALEPTAASTAGVSVERSSPPALPGALSSSGVAATAAPAQLVVHVVGQVKRPGLVRLQSGARVADAISAAGGATSRADLSALNLARLVVDGEQVHVPRPGESLPSAGTSGAPGGAAGGGAAGSSGGLVNLNTADLAALDTLPGVGPVLAQRILDWRADHGRFTSLEELGEVTGIGEKLYAQIRPKVTL